VMESVAESMSPGLTTREKGVTTRACVVIFCEHYSFVSSFESF
jgi:hypothetical protein